MKTHKMEVEFNTTDMKIITATQSQIERILKDTALTKTEFLHRLRKAKENDERIHKIAKDLHGIQ